MESNIPSLLAILLCDRVIIEQQGGKKTVVGIFDDLWAAQVPAGCAMGFFARMTDLEGQYRFIIKVVRVSAEGEIMVGQIEFPGVEQLDDRLKNLDIAVNLPPLVFPTYGKYEFQLFANEIYIGRAVLSCRQPEVAQK